MSEVIRKFLKYVSYNTQSDDYSETFPSTAVQHLLAERLEEELRKMGAADVVRDTTFGYVYAKIPATPGMEHRKTLGFLAHMDTSPEVSGENVRPRIISDYDGGDICLNDTVFLKPEEFPELREYVGKSLIVTDGTTLLGADDKAGIAEIMTMAERLLSNPSIEHGPIAIAFTPDEEVGSGVDHIDLAAFGADYAYTVDGGAIGELEYENFNAASAVVTVCGRSVHPGEAKNKMLNAVRIATEFESMLPDNQKPERTEGYEGFFHLRVLNGDIETATMEYIIRDHDRTLFEEKKRRINEIAESLNTKYGSGTVSVELKDQYYNMREVIEDGNMFLVDKAKAAMESLGMVPKIRPIRGGTDGARLSFMGVPCPNLCTGGHNFHGRYEYICIESMEAIVNLLTELAKCV